MSAETLKVVVLTPFGRGGWGGIDRLMDEVRTEIAGPAFADIEVRFLTTRGNGHVIGSLPRMLGCAATLVFLKMVRRIDLLHVNLAAHGSARRKMALVRLAKALGVPYVVHLHADEFQDYWDGLPERASASLATFFRDAVQVVVLGAYWRDLIVARAPEARDRVRIVQNGSRHPPEPAAGTPGRPHILFLGRLGDRKGVPTLIKALGRLGARSDWRATLAGDGGPEPFRSLLASEGVADRVDLPGWVGPPAVDALLAGADILVLPSRQEGLPMAVIEGMAYGLAVVSTPVGAIPEIVHPEDNGMLTSPDDPEGLADVLARLLDDPALRARLGARARLHHRQRLEIGGCVARLADIWRTAHAEAAEGRR